MREVGKSDANKDKNTNTPQKPKGNPYQIEAKTLLATQNPQKTTFVFLLFTMGLSLLMNLFIPYDFVYRLVNGDFSVIDGVGTTYLFLFVLITTFSWVMHYGFMQWSLRVAKGQSPQIPSLIEGFGITAHVLWLSLLKMGCVYAWLCVFIFTALTPLLFLIFMSNNEGTVYLLAILFGILVASVLLVLYLRYVFGEFFLMEQREKNAYKALGQSSDLQRNHLQSMVKFHLSFWKWGILFVLSQGLYVILTYGFNQFLNPAEVDAYSPLAYWISIAVDWGLLLHFLPQYYVSLSLFYLKLDKTSTYS